MRYGQFVLFISFLLVTFWGAFVMFGSENLETKTLRRYQTRGGEAEVQMLIGDRSVRYRFVCSRREVFLGEEDSITKCMNLLLTNGAGNRETARIVAEVYAHFIRGKGIAESEWTALIDAKRAIVVGEDEDGVFLVLAFLIDQGAILSHLKHELYLVIPSERRVEIVSSQRDVGLGSGLGFLQIDCAAYKKLQSEEAGKTLRIDRLLGEPH